MADRLAQIVDRYMPKVADENRTYVMRYPGQVKTMLQKAWGLRKSICDRANKKSAAKAGRRGQASASGEPDSFAQQRAGRWKKVAVWGGKAAMHVKRERGVSEDTPPDWGMTTALWEAQKAQMMTTGTTTCSSASGHGVQGETIGQRWRHWTPNRRPNEPAGEQQPKKQG